MKKQNLKKSLVLAKKTVSRLDEEQVLGGAGASGGFACTRSQISKCATQMSFTRCAVCNSWYC
ncbi:class I lanthipeptide [Kordia sp.]|uniref:class I lanthipeptide n=1 Tax=Kordia sp. TaxID=1965332 RepID=UPI003D6AAB7B